MEKKEQPTLIKVIRVIEYTGTVEWIDKTLNAGSVPKNGAIIINHPDGYKQKISSATIGTFANVFMVDFDKLLSEVKHGKNSNGIIPRISGLD